MGLFKFYWTDAIASAGGTQIKSVDTRTTVDISGYGNILGAIYLEFLDYTTRFGLVLLKNRNETAFFKFTSTVSDGCDVDFSTLEDIRVFYF